MVAKRKAHAMSFDMEDPEDTYTDLEIEAGLRLGAMPMPKHYPKRVNVGHEGESSKSTTTPLFGWYFYWHSINIRLLLYLGYESSSSDEYPLSQHQNHHNPDDNAGIDGSIIKSDTGSNMGDVTPMIDLTLDAPEPTPLQAPEAQMETQPKSDEYLGPETPSIRANKTPASSPDMPPAFLRTLPGDPYFKRYDRFFD